MKKAKNIAGKVNPWLAIYVSKASDGKFAVLFSTAPGGVVMHVLTKRQLTFLRDSINEELK